MSSDENLFLTQSTFKHSEDETPDTDGILSDVMDLQHEQKIKNADKENIQPNFNLKNDIFSDISEEELVKVSQEVECLQGRFLAPLQQCDPDKLVKEGLSKKTESKTLWAIRVFEKWQQERKNGALKSTNVFQVFDGNLLDMSASDLNAALGFFVAEVRKKNGEEYRPNTLYELVIAIQHHFRQNGRFLNFLDDAEFDSMRRVLDAKMKNLSKQGIGMQRKQAEVIIEQQECLMWERGILGMDTPQKLLDTLVFVLGLHFALRAGQEHRNLRFGPLAQIQVKTDSKNNKYLEYHEDVSKTNRGGILHRKTEAKVTRAYENVEFPDRCPVRIYEKYISVRPENSKVDALYLRPRKYPLPNCWYSDVAVGVHQLQQTVGKLCQSAGFKGHYTNHSLRATAATRLYEAGMDEQLVIEKTGHRSNAVRSYKRTSDNQLVEVSKVLHGQKDVSSLKKAKLDSTDDCHSERHLNITAGDMSVTLKF